MSFRVNSFYCHLPFFFFFASNYFYRLRQAIPAPANDSTINSAGLVVIVVRHMLPGRCPRFCESHLVGKLGSRGDIGL